MSKSAVFLLLGALFVSGCATKGSEDWCDTMKKTSYSSWTTSDVHTYASHCLSDSTMIGSSKWCEDQKGENFSKWTQEETSNYVKTCLVN